MAKFFIDTEFISCRKKPISWLPTFGNFNKPYHSLQLISIGIKCEDSREYYAISKEYNYADANDWVKENVITRIYCEELSGIARQHMSIETFHKHILNGKTNRQIAGEIMMFIMDPDGSGLKDWDGFTDDYFSLLRSQGTNVEAPVFYADYGGFDYVIFSSLFGEMDDYPKTWPMYFRELQQIVDDKVAAKQWFYGVHIWASSPEQVDCAASFEDKVKKMESHDDYPRKRTDHQALEDAKFNFELYKFLQKF